MRDTHSRLFYVTGEEVQLGDHVIIKRWIRRSLQGTVCYIPGISSPHPDLEDESGSQWAVRLVDGTVLSMGYDPSSPYGQPTKRLNSSTAQRQ